MAGISKPDVSGTKIASGSANGGSLDPKFLPTPTTDNTSITRINAVRKDGYPSTWRTVGPLSGRNDIR